MKKYFYSLFAAAAMMLATVSCSQDEFADATGNGETVNVSFTVSAETKTATRALTDGTEVGEGNLANNLIYAVYESGKEECLIQSKVSEASDGVFNVTIPLVKGLKYDVLFLAYNEGNNVFGITQNNVDKASTNPVNLKALTLKDDLTANQEAYDVFYAAETGYSATGAGKTVYLKRPFAQVNVGTTLQDLKNAATLKVAVKQSDITIKGLPTTFNVYNGAVDGEKDITFSAADIFTSTTKVKDAEGNDTDFTNEAFTVNGDTYYYLGMTYVLVGADKDFHDAAVSFYRENATDAFNAIEIPFLPLQRNYRTNIVGNLLTTTDEFNVVIVPTFDGNYGPTDMLMEAFANGGEVTLPYNVKLTEPLVVPEGKAVVLNLNGYSMVAESGNCIQNKGTLTVTGEGTIESGTIYAINNSGTLTVESGNIGAIFNSGSLTVNDGVIANTVSGKHGIYHSGSELTINGGTFSTTSNNELINDASSTKGDVIINAGTFTQNGKSYLFGPQNAGIVINGGTFNGYVNSNGTNDGMRSKAATVKGGTFNFDPKSYLAEGYEVKEKTDEEGNTLYYVVPQGTKDVTTITTVDELFAFAADVNGGKNYAGEVVILAADIDLKGQTWTPIGDCESSKYFQGTFDGQNHTISNLSVDKSTDTYMNSTAGLFGWIDAASATIKNVKVDGATVKGSHWVGVIAGYFTGRIEKCTVTNATVEGFNVNSDANGDKIGGIVGCLNEHSYINDNNVSNSTIKGNRDIGGIAGSVAASTYEMKNNKVSNVAITYTTPMDYGSAGEIVSGRTGYVADNTNTFENVTVTALISSNENLVDAIKAGVTEITLADGEYTMPRETLGEKTYTIIGSRNTKLDVTDFNYNGNQSAANATLNFEGITLKFKTAGNYNGFTHTKAISLTDCELEGNMFMYSPATFTNCDFNSDGAEHNAWTYGSTEVSFTNCKFTYGDRAVNCYLEDPKNNSLTVDVTFTNCTFTKVTGKDTTGAIETNSYYMKTLNLNINNCTVSEGDLWWVSEWNNNKGANTVVTIDGKQVFPVAFIGETAYPTFEAAYDAAQAGDEIKLLGGVYNPENKGGKSITISAKEGEEVTFKLYNEGEDGCDYTFGSAGTSVATYIFNNITFDTTGNTGNYKGYAYMGATYNNCKFVGAWSLNNSNTYTFKNCTFDFKNGYLWTWAAKNATFEGCTFNGNSKTILAHGGESTTITIKDCTFAATEKGYTGSGDNTACVEIDPTGTNTYTISFEGTNTKTDSYAGWTRVKDGSTGHTITGVTE